MKITKITKDKECPKVILSVQDDGKTLKIFIK